MKIIKISVKPLVIKIKCLYLHPERCWFQPTRRVPGTQTQSIMANKVYRVVACIGRKRNVIFESKEFDPTDGCADYDAFKETVRAREQHCMDLWGAGYSVTTDGRYHHIGKNLDAGRIEIVLSSK